MKGRLRFGSSLLLAAVLVSGRTGAAVADTGASAGPPAESGTGDASTVLEQGSGSVPPAPAVNRNVSLPAATPPAAPGAAPRPMAATPGPAPSTTAKPDVSRPSAFFAGARLGFEARSGDVTVDGSAGGPGFSMSNTVHYTGHQKIPLTLDIGGRLSPNVTLGGYARLAAVLGGQTDTSWSVGGVVGVLPAPATSTSPWIAVAVGYQSLGADAPLTGLEISPQVGLLFRTGNLAIGPVAELTLVDYSADANICSNCSGWNAWGSLALRVGWM